MADGRRLRRTGLLVYEWRDCGERERVRVVFHVRARMKVVPRKEDWGEAEAEVVVDEIVESMEESVVWARFGWLNVVVRESRRAEIGCF
jgi:hypothetical protein